MIFSTVIKGNATEMDFPRKIFMKMTVECLLHKIWTMIFKNNTIIQTPLLHRDKTPPKSGCAAKIS